MNFNSSGYFAYKKNKIQNELKNEQKKPISRFSFLCQLFFATFIVIFIIIVVSIMKYSTKMDIECAKGDLSLSNDTLNHIPSYTGVVEEDQQRKIDKRLILIQQEENAPSEARIIDKAKHHPEVIAMEHIKNNKKIEKAEKQKLQKEKADFDISPSFLNNSDVMEAQNNIIVMSKVLIGRFGTFDEAQKLQNQIKAKNQSLQPFVRKVGNVFSVQMGSYQDFNIAKSQAQVLRNNGYDVWIYQQ